MADVIGALLAFDAHPSLNVRHTGLTVGEAVDFD